MTANNGHVLLYGLRVDSELALHVSRSAHGDAPADVIVRMGDEVAAADRAPPGRLLLELALGRRLYAATARADGGYVVRCHGTCDFVVDAGLRHVTVHLVVGADPGLASVLATGMLLSFILTMRGAAVLHASAVEIEGSALAFVGSTGMGKSTMAAVMCADGATLVTDDVLRIDLGEKAGVLGENAGALPDCHVGTTELRLRKSARDFATLFDDPVTTRRTADGRNALRLRGPDPNQLPLSAIVIPVRDLDASRRTPTIERLDATTAMLTLLRFPRLPGWQDPATLSRQFHHLGEIVERVPVSIARLPAGALHAPGVALALRDAVSRRS